MYFFGQYCMRQEHLRVHSGLHSLEHESEPAIRQGYVARSHRLPLVRGDARARQDTSRNADSLSFEESVLVLRHTIQILSGTQS